MEDRTNPMDSFSRPRLCIYEECKQTNTLKSKQINPSELNMMDKPRSELTISRYHMELSI